MCQFCHQHGEGKKWYLQAKNYSDDLLSDVRRRKFITEFASDSDKLSKAVEGMEKLDKAPAFIAGIIRRLVTRKQKKIHFGQVIPIEDIEQILSFVNNVTRVACICRHMTLGKEKRYCYGFSVSPDGGSLAKLMDGLDNSFYKGPDVGAMETLGKAEALEALRGHEKEGLCHTIWTFVTPFIGGVCNCDRADCLAMRCTITHRTPVMFRGEWVARVDADKCKGCRNCMRFCQFGALSYSASNCKVVVDQTKCYGCGTCRAGCASDAITLLDRKAVPAVANLWE